MDKRSASILVFCVSLVLALATESRASDPAGVNLTPTPKEVRMYEGGFHLGQKTRILVQLGHQQDDRIAAETLAEQVEDQSGLKLDIVSTKPSSRAEDGVIMLVRLQDARVRHFLATKGLRADADVGDQGYLLFSDKTHLIVAANTGQGLFSGVQTLRQLLRPDGKSLICPAVAIRDWPSSDDRAVQDGVSRGTPPAFPQLLRGPRS